MSDENKNQNNEELENVVDDESVEITENETIDECEKCEEYKAGWMRAQADYQNLLRETEEKRGEWAAMSKLQILEEFIPIYDNFKKAFSDTNIQINANDTNNDSNLKKWLSWKQGIEYIMKQFGEVLKRHNVEEIKTVGEKFDTNMHEAMGEEEAEGKEEGVVIREVDSGYTMNGKVIKTAKVIIAK